MTSEELISFLKKRQGMLEGVAVTGGEPLLREESLELLREIRALGYPVKLDSNGTHPDRLRRAAEEGLIQYCAMDIKNSPERYAETAGLSEIALTAVRESVDFLKTGSIDYEFRTTAVKPFHEAADFAEIGRMIEGAERYFVQCFADRDTVPYSGLSAPSKEELKAFADAVRPYVLSAEIRGADL